MMENLTSKIKSWEAEKGIRFLYNKVRNQLPSVEPLICSPIGEGVKILYFVSQLYIGSSVVHVRGI